MDKNKEKKFLIILIVCLVFLDQIIKIIMVSKNENLIQKNDNIENIKYLIIGLIAFMAIIRYINSNNSFLLYLISFESEYSLSVIIDR